MNIDELRHSVKNLRINPSFYSILDSKPVNGHVLRQDGNDWVVYYLDERGGIHEKRFFETENEACVFLASIGKWQGAFWLELPNSGMICTVSI